MVLIGVGRTADVYVVDERWVLRRYRKAAHGDAEAERALMTYLHRHGYPVPVVRPGEDAPGTDLVMERLDGPTMAGALFAGLITPREAGAVLALLLAGLHSLPPRASADPEERILHLDLHPENVILTSAGPRVIDWGTAAEGRPGLDWAMTAVIVAQAGAGDVDLAGPARELLAALLTDPAAAHLTPEALTEALRRRASDPTMTEREIDLLGQAGVTVREAAGLQPA
ncbi:MULTISPECIES: phosphotransferase [Streptomyces]|uniref:Phosphotransferase n=1 Tax=Streptomyces chilikensis TaxID=1194079 RepID=A0ABV3EX67_9ACTN|nr:MULTISPECIES: phosphotransferase [Streptomyces]MDH6227181.1 aminoglycoside phosphotransferase (APT) family kinase protein [Streptomyces sp. MJP52]